MIKAWTSRAPAVSLPMKKGHMLIWRPRPSVIVTQGKGHLTEDVMATILRWKDKTLSEPEPSFYHDWDGLTSYDTGARVVSQQWLGPNAEKVHRIHLSATAPLIRMGVTVVALMSRGKLVLHDSVNALDTYLEQEARARR